MRSAEHSTETKGERKKLPKTYCLLGRGLGLSVPVLASLRLWPKAEMEAVLSRYWRPVVEEQVVYVPGAPKASKCLPLRRISRIGDASFFLEVAKGKLRSRKKEEDLRKNVERVTLIYAVLCRAGLWPLKATLGKSGGCKSTTQSLQMFWYLKVGGYLGRYVGTPDMQVVEREATFRV